LAVVGYDVTRFVQEAATKLKVAGQDSSDPVQLADAIRAAPPFDGIGIRLDFRGGQVNQAMFYHRYRDGRVELLR
jgi:hypothetical protein